MLRNFIQFPESNWQVSEIGNQEGTSRVQVKVQIGDLKGEGVIPAEVIMFKDVFEGILNGTYAYYVFPFSNPSVLVYFNGSIVPTNEAFKKLKGSICDIIRSDVSEGVDHQSALADFKLWKQGGLVGEVGAKFITNLAGKLGKNVNFPIPFLVSCIECVLNEVEESRRKEVILAPKNPDLNKVLFDKRSVYTLAVVSVMKGISTVEQFFDDCPELKGNSFEDILCELLLVQANMQNGEA